MGRMFEKRKHRIFARNAKMSKIFTKIGREITMAVKSGGPDPGGNSRLRAAIQNGKANNMPKDRVDAAINKAAGKDEASFEELLYEGYAPYGVALMIETATDNPTRTVANVRMYLTRNNGSLGTAGSVAFTFERKALFKIEDNGMDLDDLTLEAIDFGADEISREEDGIYITLDFVNYGKMQSFLESKGFTVLESEKMRVPTSTVELSPNQIETVQNLIDLIEDDDDVQAVFHNMRD